MSVGYGTDSDFRAYHTERGRDVNIYTDPQIASARLIASEWLDGAFRDHFRGLKTAPYVQEREWPRTGVIDYYGYGVSSAIVPQRIERATYEAAYRELQSADALNRDSTPKPYKRVAIEGAISVEYGSQDAASLLLQMPIIGQILSYLIYGEVAGLSGRSVRA